MNRVRTHTNPFNYYHRMTPIAFAELFENPSQPLDLEVGFGRGVFLRAYADLHPKRNLIGVEVRKQIVEIMRERLSPEQNAHVHVVHGNAQILLEDSLPNACLDRVFVFHPDPWFKKSHHKRRVINDQFCEVLSRKLKPGGRLYISTDVDVLHEYMVEVMGEQSSFSPIQDQDFWENEYQTHWDAFSEMADRNLYKQVYELNNKNKCF